MTDKLEARVCYERPDGREATLFLGYTEDFVSIKAGTLSAAREALLHEGKNLRLVIYNRTTDCVLVSTSIRDDILES